MTDLPEQLDFTAEKVNILLVDEAPANLLDLRAILEDLDHHLVEVRPGDQARLRLQQQEFAVMLIVLQSPSMRGLETAKVLRDHTPSRHTPMILVAGEPLDRQQLEMAYAVGAVDVLVRPLLPMVLQAKVRAFIALYQCRQIALQEANQLRRLVHVTPGYSLCELDPHGRVVTWNEGAERCKGYKAQEIIGQHLSRFYPQEAIDRGWPDDALRIAASQGSFEDEGWQVRHDGSQFWAKVAITAHKDPQGYVLGFLKITRDLTASKLAAESAQQLAAESAQQLAEATAAHQVIHEERERLHVTLASIGDAVISTDAKGYVDFLNPVAEKLVGWKSGEAVGRQLAEVFKIVNEDTRQPVENPALRALREGIIVGLANHTILIAKDGSERPIDDSAAPIRNLRGDISGSVLVFRDISERKRNEAALGERLRLLALNADVGEALVQGDSLAAMLQSCCESLVEHLQGAFARIWTLDPQEDVLRLRASAGVYTHLDGPHSRVPVGKYKIGMIAQEKQPHLTNAVVGDPRVSDQEWAKREGMVAFAGYPLVVDERLVGVMAMFARQPLSETTLDAMASVADEIAVGIERKTAQERLHEQQEWLSVTLASIGDAVITTDAQGRVTFLNAVAAEMTGWTFSDADGQALETVFPIVNEQTRKTVPNPVEKVLREGIIVGLANHTVLIAKDGTERPIDDSAAPIRDRTGRMIGVVLIFRDVTNHRRAEQELRTSEARKSAILDTALDCIITMDHNGNVVEFNPAAENTFGYRRDQILGHQLAEFIIPPALREQHRQGMTRYLATGNGPVLGKRLELPAMRADGTEFPVEIAITRIATDGPPLFTAYLRDVSEQKRTERHRNARIAVTHALSDAEGLNDGASELLKAVCDNLGWELGFYWIVSQDETMLHCVQSWHRSDVTVAEFETDSFARTFRKGTGLPGLVWSSGKPRWLLNVVNEREFPRAAAAAACNLHTAFACPVMVGDRTLGVIEFFSSRIQPPDVDLLEMMGTVAGNFGQFLERKAAEEKVRHSERELADFFENATVGMHWVGSDGKILRANRAELRLLGYSREEYVGRAIADFHADEATICDILSRLQRGEELSEYPARLKCKDGAIKDVLIDSSVMFRDGEFVHTRCFTRDVTDSKRSEAALHEAQRRFEAVFNQQFQFMAILAPDGRVLEANQTCFNVTGIRHQQVLGQLFWEAPWWDQFPVVQETWKTLIAQAQQTSGPATGEVEYGTADGCIRHATAVVTGLKDDSGRVTGLVVEAHDDTERKQQEAALRESEGKLRLLADTIPQLAWMASPDGNIFWYNRRWYEYTGTTPADMVGWGWQSVHSPDTLPEVIKRWQWCIESGEPFDMVFPIKGANGQFRPFLTRVNPFTNDRGQIVYWFGTNTDVAELREAKEALAVSEERLRLALDAGRMGVWDWDIQSGELNWSDSLEPLHGLAPGTFGGTFHDFQQLIHPLDRDSVNLAIRQALDQGGEFYVEFRSIWPDGSIHWIAGSGKVFGADDGRSLRMIGIGLDVTLRKRGEQTSRFLADASAALAVIVDFDSTLQKVSSLAVPAFADWSTVDLVEPDGSLRRVSVSHVDPAKVKLAHEIHRRFPPDPHAPQGVWNIVRTGNSELVAEITDELLVQANSDDEFIRILRQLGLKSYIGVPLIVRGKTLGVITFINAESGHRYCHEDLAVAEDLASRAAIAIENAQLYRELRDADQRKDEFLATLAHELRNPLAPIRNGLQVMRLSGGDGGMVDEARSMMERQLSQMVRLVDDLLDVSRITRNKLELRREKVSLNSVVHNAVETSRPLFEQVGHTFSLSLPAAAVYLDADLTRLAQVFSNLLNNAAKYTEPGGRISLTGELQDAEIVVQIKDNGLGIPADSLPRIFDMFSQVDRNMERAQGGLGIGLTLVRRLVEMHGGTVDAHSDGRGQGSVFSVRLPVYNTCDPIPAPLTDETMRAAIQRRILVVDDNRDSATSLSMMLNLMGNQTHTAHDGLAAVEAAEEFRPDMILLDIGLPKMNGYDACRVIRQKPWSKGIVIVALTGWGQDTDRRRSAEAGFDHHMVKPIEVNALAKLLADP